MALIFNFCALGAAIICFEVSSRYLRRKEEKTRAIRDFYLGFSFVGLGYIFLSLPQLILLDPFRIQIAFILQDVSFLVSMLFFGPAVLSMFSKWSRFQKNLSSIVLFWTGLYIVLNIIFFSPAAPLKTDGIIYFWQSGTPWLQSVARALLVTISLIISTLFFSEAKKTFLQKKLFWRSFFGALGSFMIALAGFILWLSPFFYFSPSLLVFSGGLGLLGFFVGWVGIGWVGGIVLRPAREKFVKKIT